MASHAAVRQEARELRDIIRKIITELDEHHRNVNIATAIGSVASFLGGVMTVASPILAIPTGGLTLPLAGAGSMFARAGGVVSIGATLVEFIIHKHKVSDVQRRWERFQTDLAGYYAEIYRCEEVPAKILNIVGDIINGVIEVRQGYQLIRGSMEAARALRVGGVGGRIAAGASQVGNMIEAGAVGGVAGLGDRLTLPFAGAGAILAGAVGAVSIGASLVEFINQRNVSDVQRRWERFPTDLAGYCAQICLFEEVPAKIINIFGDIINGVTKVCHGYQLIKGSMEAAGALRVGGVSGRIAAGASQVGNMIEAGAVGGVAGLGARAVGGAFFFLNVVLIPISLIELVRSASAANSGERSKASSSLERLADFLDQVANNQL